MPDHVGVARRGHRDHVAEVPGGPQLLEQPEPVTVGQVHVEQDQVDVPVGVEVRAPRPPAERATPATSKPSTPADVRRVGLRGRRLVLDDEHPHGHRRIPPVDGAERHRELRAADGEVPMWTSPPWRRAHLADQGEAEPAAAAAGRLGGPAALEDPLAVLGGQAGPAVADGDRQPAVGAVDPDRDPALGPPTTASRALSTRLPATVTRSRGLDVGGRPVTSPVT